MTKGEISCLEQFFFLSRCFQKSSAEEASVSVYMWERVKWGRLLWRNMRDITCKNNQKCGCITLTQNWKHCAKGGNCLCLTLLVIVDFLRSRHQMSSVWEKNKQRTNETSCCYKLLLRLFGIKPLNFDRTYLAYIYMSQSTTKPVTYDVGNFQFYEVTFFVNVGLP